MTKRQTFELAAGLLLWVAILGVVQHYRNEAHKPATKPAAQAQSNPCPDNKPCIELTAADGKKYKLNDFRFLPDHCIAIISLPDNTSRKLCGSWHMDWIGPDTTNGIKAQTL